MIASSELTTFRDSLGDLCVTPDIPPGQKPSLGSGKEELDRSSVRDASSAWSTFLIYVDAEGERSERRVTCKSISGDGRPIYFHGYCHERKAPRCFRIDRIVELIDYRTGEVVDPLRHFEELRMHGLIPMRDRSLADLALTMTFMARCDGDFHPLEAAAIEHGLARYLVRSGGSDTEMENVVRNIPAIAPDADDVVSAVDRLLKAEGCPSIARLILDCSGDVMKADQRFASEEAVWSSQLHDILLRAANS